MKITNKTLRKHSDIFVYVGSVLLPLLILIPITLKHFELNFWGIGGLGTGVVATIIILMTTLSAEKRGPAIGTVVAIVVIAIVLIVSSKYLPEYTVPAIFFICYYVVDCLAIVTSILLKKVSPKKKRPQQSQQ